MVERVMLRGDFDARLERLRAHYRERCERLLELLPRLQAIRFGLPEGGFSVWVEMERMESDERLLGRALAKGVAFDPGALFRPEPHLHATLALRLSFSAVPLERMRDGIQRLAAVLSEARGSATKRREVA
jgi:DNA-binding transcriptional MocR family regulator